MIIFLHIVQSLFALLALGLLFGFASSRHIGVLSAALVFGSAAAASFYLATWWPLLVGFVLSWVLRKVGLDPSPEG